MRFFRLPLAMAAFLMVCYGFSTVSADELEVTGYGDSGVTSYASEYGQADFEIVITSVSGDHSNVQASAEFNDDWSGDSEFTDCNGNNFDNASLDDGETLTICFSATIPEDSDSEIEAVVSVESDETSEEYDISLKIIVSNWFAYSEDEAKGFEFGDTQSYTIRVENIKVDESGESESVDDTISIRLTDVGVGWHINCSYSGWNIMESEATINGLDAGQTLDLIFEITLVSKHVPASSYVGGNNYINFEGRDSEGVYQYVSLEAIVFDRFEVSIEGGGNQLVENGCTDNDESLSWEVTIRNYGNTIDSFDVSFDTSDVDAAGWNVDGAGSFNTGNLLPIFENGNYELNLEMHVPSGLPAGTSHGFTMTVVSDNDSDVLDTMSFTATIQQCYDISISVDRPSANGNPGQVVDFDVTVTNNGNGEDTIDFVTMGSAAWNSSVSQLSTTIPAGSSAHIVFSLTVPEDAEAGAKSGIAMVHAFSEGCVEQTSACEYEEHVSVTVTANQIFAIIANYYTNETGVEMSSAEVEEGMQVQMYVTVSNSGNGGDRVTIELVGAPAWVVLSKDTALVSKGGSDDIAIDVSAPASDAAGDHTFQVKATSQDGTTTSTTYTLTITVQEKSTSDGSDEEIEEDENVNCTNFDLNAIKAALAEEYGVDPSLISIDAHPCVEDTANADNSSQEDCTWNDVEGSEGLLAGWSCDFSEYDEDGDGILNDFDSCPNTKQGQIVDKYGCAVVKEEEKEEEDYEGDEAGECSDEADNDKDGLFDCDDDTCAGSPACKATDIVEAVPEEGLSSLSFVSALISIGLIARYRRK